MSAAGKVFFIPAGLPFVDVLARHLLDLAKDDPLKLAEMLVLLPNRRSCRSLKEAFLRLSQGRPLLLPRLKPMEPDLDDLHDLDLTSELGIDLPAAAPPLERQLVLTRLIMEMGEGRGGRAPSPEQAARLARELGGLLDSCHIEELSFDRLHGLVAQEYAAHWQITIDFLKIVTQHWPALLGGRIDHQDWVNRVIDAQTERWRSAPPEYPVIAAGATGARPAVARMLRQAAELPQGAVVLAGLDRHLDNSAWEQLEETHPQFTLKLLLDRLGIERGQVRPLSPLPDPRASRSTLLSEALRPAQSCEAWRNLGDFPAALTEVSLLNAPGPREEAGAIALILREALETPGRTAALVTPDRDLARRVAAEMERWDIAIDDSAGRPLMLSGPATFLRLLAEAIAADFPPHAILSLAKHPLAAAGMEAGRFRGLTRRLETEKVLRGPRPAPGLAGLRAACAEDAKLIQWLDAIESALSPFIALMRRDDVNLADLLRAHIAAAEALAGADEQSGAERLWRGEEGEAASRFLADLAEALDALGPSVKPLPPAFYPPLLVELLNGRNIRSAWGLHPRLFIWGPVEARLQHADVMILAGLNEGVWPGQADADPWMSRPMRKEFGLPAPERRIGQSAYDFAQAFAAPRVVLSRSARMDGAPTVPSRWLMRLDAVMQAGGLQFGDEAQPWLRWHAALDQAETRILPQRPAPRPPIAARPRKLSVTEIETWMRDPYGIYARHVLGLRALDPIDADPGMAEYGSWVHKAADRFVKRFPNRLPDNAEDILIEIGEQVFAEHADRPGIWAFWRPRFQSAARWLVNKERERRPQTTEIYSEITGGLDFEGPAGTFRLHARADRIDRLTDGTLALIDYKTGTVPSAREVAAGYAPQLPLEAAIARFGGFDGIAAAPVSQMLYWALKGGASGGAEIQAGKEPVRLTDEAIEGLAGLIAAFDDPDTPYEARPHPEFAPKYSDYQHLARVKEWASAEQEDEE